MPDLNKVFLLGRLGKDPEVSYTPNGDAVSKFSVATSKKWKGKDGKPGESTEWHNCTAWGKLAEICGEYLRKGSQVHIEGELKTNMWEKDGEKKYRTEIIVKDLIMLGGKQGGGSDENSSGGGDGNKTSDEHIPF